MATWNKGFRLTWLGHSAFELVSSKDKVVLFDPWLEGNPRCPKDRKHPARADAIALSHAHGDHSSDVVKIAARLGCTVIGGFEVIEHLGEKGLKNGIGMNPGGTVRVAGLAFTMVPAVHSRSEERRVGKEC